MAAQEYRAPESIGLLQQRALLVGVVALVLSIVGAVKFPGPFYQSYLMSFMLLLGLTLGSLGLLMLQHLTGGQWGIIIRRSLESAVRTLPLLLAFFLPIIFFGMKHLYAAWLDPDRLKEQPLSDLQKTYLTAGGFQFRALIYFAIWLALMFVFDRLSKQQDVNQSDRALRRRLKMLAGPGIILYAFAMSFAAIDWVMSLSPHWAYFDFSQLLIIWSGNLPEEISFYRTRLYGGWGVVAVLVLVFHFFVPFFLLLSQNVKRNAKVLPKIAQWLIFMRLVDLFWMTRPEFTSRALPSWLDIVLPLALGGLWLGLFAFNLRQYPLLPIGDPNLEETLEHHEH